MEDIGMMPDGEVAVLSDMEDEENVRCYSSEDATDYLSTMKRNLFACDMDDAVLLGTMALIKEKSR